MQKLETKLNQYEKYLIDNGYDSVNLEIILRETKDSHQFFQNKGKIEVPEELFAFVPFGNPPPFTFGYAYLRDSAYGTAFRSQDTAVHLMMKSENPANVTNSMLMLDLIQPTLDKLIVETRDQSEVLNSELVVPENTIDLNSLKSLQGLESIIFSMFTKRKMLILGPLDEITNLMKLLIALVPPEFQKFYSFAVNLPHMKHTFNVVGLENRPQLDVQKEIDHYLNLEYDMVNLYEKRCYGEFSSHLTNKIYETLFGNDDLERARSIANEAFQLAQTIEITKTIEDVANSENIEFDDAELIVYLRDNFTTGVN